MNGLKNRSAMVLLIFALGSVAAIQGGEFWQKKAYTQWSEKECQRLLENSPWAQIYTLSQTLIEPLQKPGLDRGPAPNPASPDARLSDPTRSDDTGRAREARPQIKYQAQFRSALPVRQALVRLGQIKANYDEMQPDQQRAFDQKAEEFLTKRFPETIVLHVSYRSNVQVDDRELALYWQKQTSETLKNFVFLIGSGGEKIPLLGYWVAEGAGREFQFIFPREYKDEPLIGPQNKTLQLEFPHPKIRGQGEARVLISFKVEKMLINGATVH